MTASHPVSSHVLVASQLAGVVGCCVPYPDPARGPVLALALCVAGAGLGLAALWHNRPGNFSVYPEPRRGARLVTSGPYSLVRHPMYAALVSMTAGIALYNAGATNAVAFGLVAVVVAIKARREERHLLARFAEYEGYAARTRRFVPLLY